MSRLVIKLAVCIAMLQCVHYAVDLASIQTSAPVYTADGPIAPPDDPPDNGGGGGNLLRA